MSTRTPTAGSAWTRPTQAPFAVSGATEIDKRPGLLAALESLRIHGAGVLVVGSRAMC